MTEQEAIAQGRAMERADIIATIESQIRACRQAGRMRPDQAIMHQNTATVMSCLIGSIEQALHEQEAT